MQNQVKKKSLLLKKNTVKKKNNKISSDQGDSINTTKERTFATIEETFEFQDHHKVSTKTTAYNTSKRDCIDRMEANKLSPFSSPSKSESPRIRGTFSPIVVKQKEVKKVKKSHALDLEVGSKKPKVVAGNIGKVIKSKTKSTKKLRGEYENEFIERMRRVEEYNKKITELSEEEMEMSICKINKQSYINNNNNNKKENSNKKQKYFIIKQMHFKIKEKYSKMYPNLKKHELKLLAAVVLIQRLWRQTKVKFMIGQFLSPRGTSTTFTSPRNVHATYSYNELYDRPTHRYDRGPDRCGNNKETTSLIQYSDENEERSIRNIKEGINLTPKSEENREEIKTTKQLIEKRMDMKEKEKDRINIVEKEKRNVSEKLDLKDLEISNEFEVNSLTKAKDIVKYVDHYREVIIKCKKEKKKKKVEKPNAFSFPESLSEKCLLHNLYSRRITSIQNLNKKNEHNESLDKISVFLPLKSSEKSKEQYMSPKKPEIVELEERFYTEVQDEYYQSTLQPMKEATKPEEQTVGSIGSVGSLIIEELINEFSKEFQEFSTKKCLKKKKRLPGISVNEKTIGFYLDSFLEFISKEYAGYFETAFGKINPRSFLKIFRVIPDEEIFESGDEEDEEDLNYPVMPNNAFFQYQPAYEEKEFVIKEDDKKYSNFLSGLIRIHNKCLSDCFSEFMEKERIERINFPWDEMCPMKTDEKMKEQIRERIPNIIKENKKKIVSISSTRLGRLYRRDTETEENNLIESLKEDYKREGKEWSSHHDYLEVRLEIVELVTESLMKEIFEEINF